MAGYTVYKWGEFAGVRQVVPIAAGEGIDYNGVAFGMRHGNVEPAGIFLVLLFDSVLLVRIAFGVMLLPFKTYGFCNVLATRGSSIGTRGAIQSRVREGKSSYCFTTTSALFRSMRY